MKTRCWVGPVVLSLALTIPGLPAAGEKDAARVGPLIDQLGSPRFRERQRAVRSLEALGETALKALRRAEDSDDRETSRLARIVVERIEKRLEGAALLAPTRLRLVAKNLPVAEAVSQLAKLSHYNVQLDPGTRAKLVQRRITLDSGEVSFWEALDLLCLKANLVEGGSFPNYNIYSIRPANGPGPPIFPVNPPRAVPVMPPRVVPVMPPRAVPVRPLRIQGAIPGQAALPAIVRAQFLQLQQVAPRPAMPPRMRRVMRTYGQLDYGMPQSGPIILADGKPQQVPTYYFGALRIRLTFGTLPAQGARGSLLLNLEVTGEPKLQQWFVTGSPRLQEVLDDLGRALSLAEEPQPYHPMPYNRFQDSYIPWTPSRQIDNKQMASLRLERGGRSVDVLRILRGVLSIQMRTPSAELIRVDNIVKAAGTTVRGKHGGWIKVLAVDTDANGNFRVKFVLERPPGMDDLFNPYRGMVGGRMVPARIQQLRIQANGNIQMVQTMYGMGPQAQITLVDAKGNPLTLVGLSAQQNNQGVIEQTQIFRTNQGQGEPARLVFTGQRRLTVDVPFTFKDVKLH